MDVAFQTGAGVQSRQMCRLLLGIVDTSSMERIREIWVDILGR